MVDVDAEEGLMAGSEERWIDPYVGRRYEADWSSTGNYHEERKGSRTFVGKFDAWNKMVAALSDLGRSDTQHATARLLVGLNKVQWEYKTDPETGENVFLVGMCLLALHLTNRGVPAKVACGMGYYLMFEEDPCTGPDRVAHCRRIVNEVRDLHAKLGDKTHFTMDAADGRLGLYR